MTEQEKMIAGELYQAMHDKELLQQRNACKEVCFEYNNLRPNEAASKTKILLKLFGKCDESVVIEQPFHCDYGYNIKVGKNFFANYNCVILDCAPVTFGDNCFVAPNCCFTTATHPFDAETRNAGLETALPITVGDNVWIGANVTVLPGVHIGNNVVIGAGSVVTRDIPDGFVAYGNPCRPHRKCEEKK